MTTSSLDRTTRFPVVALLHPRERGWLALAAVALALALWLSAGRLARLRGWCGWHRWLRWRCCGRRRAQVARRPAALWAGGGDAELLAGGPAFIRCSSILHKRCAVSPAAMAGLGLGRG
ncbi:MAG: hypothetical protein U0Z44_12055 [Kouleothrix sp.]